MLDEFNDVKLNSQNASQSEATQALPSASNTKPPLAAPVVDPAAAKVDKDVLSDDDFAKQLQAGMAELMGEIEGSVC